VAKETKPKEGKARRARAPGEEDLMAQRPFRRMGSLIPKPILGHYARKLRFAGIRKDVRVWLGSRLLLAFFAGALLLAAYLALYNPIATLESGSLAAGLFLGGFLLTLALAYMQLYYQIADRASYVERILPDFLLLTVSNLRAGMSPFAAFTHAARPEFGAFYDELLISTAKAGGRTSLPEALNEVSNYFDSAVLRRTVNLFSKGLKSGAHLAKLLTSIAQEVRRIQDLRAELTSATKTYTVFLAFILVCVMPFLLSISTHFVDVFLKINAENRMSASDASASGLPVFSGNISITGADMAIISVTVIIISSFLVAILNGIITKGRTLYGVKQFPIYAIAAYIVYTISSLFINTFLSGFSS